MQIQQDKTGHYLVLMAACFYGLNPFFAQLLFQQGLGAEVVSLSRFILPALLFSGCLKCQRENRGEVARSLALGMMGGVAIFAYFYALQIIPAATAILIYYSYPLFSVLIGWFWFKRGVSQNTLVSGALVAIAASLTVRPEGLSSEAYLAIIGCFMAPLAVATQVQYLSKPKHHLPIKQRMAWITFGHVVILLPLTLWQAPEQLFPVNMEGYFALGGIALISAALPQVLFMMGATKSSVDKNTIAGSLELVVALMTGAVLLSQPLDRLDITAMLLIFAALLIRQEIRQQTSGPVVST
ncbi:DMT family transporter [Marinomonas sp.]